MSTITKFVDAQPFRIAIVGAGNIGSTFAFQLSRVGKHEVTVVARPGSLRMQQLQRDKGIINEKGERAEVLVAERLDTNVAYDLIVVTTLRHQVNDVLPELKASKANWIQLMFNCFEPEQLRDAVGSHRCSFGMPFVQAKLNGDGKLKATIGAMGQKTLMGDQRWVDVYTAAKLPSAFEPDMALWLRCHAPMCVAFESIAISGVRRGGGASWAEANTLSQGAHECWRLIEAQGYVIYPKGKARLNNSPIVVLTLILWFMSRIKSFRELLATGINECIALVDAMVTAASAMPQIVVAKIAAMKP